MFFNMDGRIRYSEVDADRNLTIDGLVNYLQDTCMLHSETLGVGLNSLHERGVAWFLSSWQIQVNRMPQVYEKITVTTSPYEFKGFFGYRNFWIRNEAGEVLVLANSIWIYLDVAKQMPIRIPEEEANAYAPYEPKADMEYAPRKMKLPEDFVACEPIEVQLDMIDTNHHVNNCQYIKTALEVAGLTEIPKEIRAEYRSQAKLGDVFYPFLHKTDTEIIVDLRDANGVSYAPVMFLL